MRTAPTLALALGLSLAVSAPARAASPAQRAAHLSTARAMLPAARQRQLDAIEGALGAATSFDRASVDAAAQRAVGALPAVQLASLEAIALSDLVAQRDATIVTKSRALADAMTQLATISAQVTSAQRLGQMTTTLQQQLDAASDLSEQASVQLQMLMDQRSKLLQTASDIEKSVSDTDQAIVGNIKQ
jgi:hypothetical protein